MNWTELWQAASRSVTEHGWWSLVDIGLVAVGIYYLLLVVRGTRAVQLLTGVGVLLLMTVISERLQLGTLHWVLDRALVPGVIILVILFQPELRTALEQLGRGQFLVPAIRRLRHEDIERVVNELTDFAERAARDRIGALVVLERTVGMRDVIATGKPINGQLSADLLRSIFQPPSPLHDGAVIVSGDRILAAGCTLPMTDRPFVGRLQGMRHRAALGLSEHNDAVVVVISEETGGISLTVDGRMWAGLSTDTLRQRLTSLLQPGQRTRRRLRLRFPIRKRSHAASKPGV